MLNLRGHRSQRALNILLALVCLTCYTLLLILFLRPDLYQIESLINPDRTTIKPTVSVSLLALVLNAATVTLVTRCVEHSLWINLAKEPSNEDYEGILTVGETRRLAHWCTSTLERLLYLFGSFTGPDKRSWLLRISGPLLVATATVGPVLLVGISESSVKITTTESVPKVADPWLSRLDTGNVRYRGGSSYDNPTFVAALAAMRNLSAPVAPLCDDTDARSTCSVSARTVSVQATCAGRSQSNPDGHGTISLDGNDTSTFCTGDNTASELCVSLQSSSPATYGMFASGLPACSSQNLTECSGAGIDGKWAKIFGAWVNGVDTSSGSDHRLNFVDCDLTYGNITVRQNGTAPPFLDRSSYVQSTSTEPHEWGYTNFSIIQLNRIYTELGNSPYDWKLSAVGTGGNSRYSIPIAFLLLGEDANNDADTVARQIEANFEMATLHSFARGSNSSDLVFTRTRLQPVYVYRREVLLILVVPFLAMILGTWARWRVAGESIVVGYDPMGIARLGPVSGLTHGPPLTGGQMQYEESFKVWRWTRESVDQHQRRGVVTGMQAFNPNGVFTQEERVSIAK